MHRRVLAPVVKEFNLGDFDLLDSICDHQDARHCCRLHRASSVLHRPDAEIPKDRHPQWRQITGRTGAESSAEEAWKQNPELFETTRLSLDPTRSETVPPLREQHAPWPKFCSRCLQRPRTRFSRYRCVLESTSHKAIPHSMWGQPSGCRPSQQCGTQLCSTMFGFLGRHPQQIPLADTFPWHSLLITCYQHQQGWKTLQESCLLQQSPLRTEAQQ